jgi:hypothetical protein
MERKLIESVNNIKSKATEIGMLTEDEIIKGKVFEILIETIKISSLILNETTSSSQNPRRKYLVKNIRNTTGKKCHCSSWIVHYKKNIGEDLDEDLICSISGCKRTGRVGAHIMFVDNPEFGNKHFIVPMCNIHNSEDRPMFIRKGTQIVSAKNTACKMSSRK